MEIIVSILTSGTFFAIFIYYFYRLLLKHGKIQSKFPYFPEIMGLSVFIGMTLIYVTENDLIQLVGFILIFIIPFIWKKVAAK